MQEENVDIKWIPLEEALEKIVVNWDAQNKPEALVDMYHCRSNAKLGVPQAINQEYAWTKGVFIYKEKPDLVPGPFDGHYQINLIFDSLEDETYLRFKKLLNNFKKVQETEEDDYMFVLIGDETRCHIADFILSGGYVYEEKPIVVMWADPKHSHARWRKDTNVSIWQDSE